MKLIDNINTDNLIFIEVDSRPLSKSYEGLSPDHKRLWTAPEDNFAATAGYIPEFSYIHSVAIAKIVDGELKTYSFSAEEDADDKENIILTKVTAALDNLYSKNLNTFLCGYKLKSNVIPYLIKKCIIHRIKTPALIDAVGKKPWDIKDIDLFEIWQNIGYSGSKLENILFALGLPIIEGMFHPHYREDPHATQMVQTLANVFRILRREEIFDFSVPPSSPENEQIKPAGLLQQLYAQKGKITKEQEQKLTEIMNTLDERETQIAEEILKSIKKERVKK